MPAIKILGIDSLIATSDHARRLAELVSADQNMMVRQYWLSNTGTFQFVFQYLKALLSSDLVILADWRLTLFFYASRKKYIFWEVENPYHVHRSFLTKILLTLTIRWPIRNTQAILISTDQFREKLNRRYYRYRSSTYFTIAREDLSDIAFAENHGKQNQDRFSDAQIIIGYFGRFSDLTGAEELLKLVEQPGFTGNFIGPHHHNSLSQVSLDLLDRLAIKELVYPEVSTAFQAVQASDVLVGVTKLSSHDPGTKYQTPGKILDYLWTNKPIVATFSPGLEILFDYTPQKFGVYFVPQNFRLADLQETIYLACRTEIDPSQRKGLLTRIFKMNRDRISEVLQSAEVIDA